jgi:host factor-I protein
MNKPPINVQDSFFYGLRHEETVVQIVLLSGQTRRGRLKRFDRFALVLDIEGQEEMVYKHAIASIRAERPAEARAGAPAIS